MTIYDVAECVGKAYPLAFTLKNVQSGFAVSGISPINRNIFEEHEFLSSYVTDRPNINSENGSQQPSCSHVPTTAENLNQPDTTQLLVSPEQVRPFLKAKPRNSTKKCGRKPGRCRIVTDTPEKNEIEMAAQLKKSNKRSKQSSLRIKDKRLLGRLLDRLSMPVVLMKKNLR